MDITFEEMFEACEQQSTGLAELAQKHLLKKGSSSTRLRKKKPTAGQWIMMTIRAHY